MSEREANRPGSDPQAARAGAGPWDQRLARLLIRPLVGTPVHPNHLTVASLLAGLAAGVLFALGDAGGDGDLADLAAGLFMLAVFLDHTDGELARLSGRTSLLGYRLDYIVGSANYTALFVGLGLGLAQGPMGPGALVLGLAAGLSNPVIVTLRMAIERRFGAAAVAHPSGAGFQIEDFIYLIGPITWLGGLSYFFLAYGLGTLGYLGWTVWEYMRRAVRHPDPEQT